MFQYITDIIPKTNFDRYKIYELLNGYNYILQNIKDFSKIPLNRQLLNSYAIFEFLKEINFLYPLIIDPTSVLENLIKDRFDKKR